ncbi:MAG: NUDIX domain-containing protein [Planctomycetes bacterium]|nr:NUDIX domain-containing protein [Planctomycetota bacterium]
MIENLILDWSGTLADDVGTTLAATNDTLRHFGAEAVDLATYRRDFVLPVMGFYGPRLPGRSLEEIDRVFFAAFRARESAAPLFPGVRDLLVVQRSRGIRLFVLSTMAQDVLDAAVTAHGLEGFFDRVIGGAADKGPAMEELIATAGLERDRSLYVGDTRHDVEVAKASRVRAGASTWGYTAATELEAAGPDYLFADLADLVATLDREYLLDRQPLVIATVGGVVRDPRGRILLVRTRKWSDTFGIPGGKIDRGETMLEAYLREMREEVGLEVENTSFVMIQDCIDNPEFVKPRHFLLINYLSETDRPEAVVTNYEIEEHRWLSPAAALELNLNTPTRLLLDELLRSGRLALDGDER